MKTNLDRLLLQLFLVLAVAFGSALLADIALAEPAANTAVAPVPREQAWWMDRHKSMNERVKQGPVDLIFIGDSITQGWEGPGKAQWDKYYVKRNAVNLGISGDQTQHALWRLDNGNIDGISPKLAIIMIGTNNFGANAAEEIADGIMVIVKRVRDKLPQTQVLLLGIFPRGKEPDDIRTKLAKASELASKCADGKMVHFVDIGSKFLDENGALPQSIMPDFLHPNEKGYQIWAESIEIFVAKLMGEPAVGDQSYLRPQENPANSGHGAGQTRYIEVFVQYA